MSLSPCYNEIPAQIFMQGTVVEATACYRVSRWDFVFITQTRGFKKNPALSILTEEIASLFESSIRKEHNFSLELIPGPARKEDRFPIKNTLQM